MQVNSSLESKKEPNSSKWRNCFSIRNYFHIRLFSTSYIRKQRMWTILWNRKKVYTIYPEVKEKFGMNKILEKIYSFFLIDGDYNNEKTKEILDETKMDDDEAVKLKEKQDWLILLNEIYFDCCKLIELFRIIKKNDYSHFN